jgi:hypothetical protein
MIRDILINPSTPLSCSVGDVVTCRRQSGPLWWWWWRHSSKLSHELGDPPPVLVLLQTHLTKLQLGEVQLRVQTSHHLNCSTEPRVLSSCRSHSSCNPSTSAAREVAARVLTDQVEVLLSVSKQGLASCICDPRHLSSSVCNRPMDGSDPESTKSGVGAPNVEPNPPEAGVDGVAPKLAAVLHSDHPVAEELVKKPHEVGVEEVVATITNREGDDPAVVCVEHTLYTVTSRTSRSSWTA